MRLFLGDLSRPIALPARGDVVADAVHGVVVVVSRRVSLKYQIVVELSVEFQQTLFGWIYDLEE